MAQRDRPFDFDVAIVGGGPAGLSAAVVLGRSRRSVGLFDHGKPRNYAAHAVHCYLGLDGIEPLGLRERGRQEALAYGVQLFDVEVKGACCTSPNDSERTSFEIRTNERTFASRAMLLTTGIVDELPDVPGLRDFYGRSVHHCPYCDGWEHRDQKLAAIGSGDSGVKLALSLRTWSQHATFCSNGDAPDAKARRKLAANGIVCREESIERLDGTDGNINEIVFRSGPPLKCDALFFNADKRQQSPLAEMLGCEHNDEDMVQTEKKQRTCVSGLFVAGDADGDVQFAIVAAAEGAIAATAINALLQKQDRQ
jgi:thioredoxin reductase